MYLVSDVSRVMLQAIRQEGEFKAAAFIQSFHHFLSDGTLCIPGFVNTLENGDKVDMRSLKPETGGLSKQAFADFKKGMNLRTNDPFHSFFMYGKRAGEFYSLTENNTETFGHDSMFGQLHRSKAILILIDLTLYYGFTFAHYAEQELKVPYRVNKNYQFDFTNSKGVTQPVTFTVYAKKRGYIPVLNTLETPLLNAGALTKLMLNEIPVMRIELDKAFDVMAEDVKHHNAKNLINFNLGLYFKQFIKQFTNSR